MLTRLIALMLAMSFTTAAFAQWKPQQAKLMTRWAKDVKPEAPLPEYPRPQMVRETWKNLNGLWDYAITDKTSGTPEKWDGQILVPFAVESALSGVMKRVGQDKALWYRVRIPRQKGKAWDGKRQLLHFGAVDWHMTAWINSIKIGEHQGGYDPFTFDVTEAVGTTKDISDELIIRVYDPTNAGFQPVGKQHNNPHGIWYTPVTGIWQSVWMEPVNVEAVKSVKVTPDFDNNSVDITVMSKGDEVTITIPGALDGDGNLLTFPGGKPLVVTVAPGRMIGIKPPVIYAWSPAEPWLYPMTIQIRSKGVVVDTVESYFAMRKISMAKDDAGVIRLHLNNKPLFQFGPLDQGWWPDGLYTAPTDEALKYDIEITKKLGFNMIRKHVKVEPARWYHHCDKLGMLVWQDMPNGDKGPPWSPNGEHDGKEVVRDKSSADNFNNEWKAIIDSLYNHPSIIMWVPFNEAWGQFDTVRVTEWTKKYDPSRLVNCASGGNDFPTGDILDLHNYPGPAAPKPDGKRAIVLGEYGGLGLPVEGHTWLEKGNWGYRSFKTSEELTTAYIDLATRLRPLIGEPGLAAAIYTQTTDVEVEVNGFLTYDRSVMKMDLEKVAAANRKVYLPPPITKEWVPTSRDENAAGATWQYTFAKPADGWEKPDFDAGKWQTGKAGFGEPSTPGSTIRTLWKTNDIWIRRSFELPADVGITDPKLLMHHDEDTEVYINGELAVKVPGWTTAYTVFTISDKAKATLKPGTNTIAIHTKQTGGGQYIDAGIIEVIEQVKRE